MNRILEICADSLPSARAAVIGGADRLELCSALALGGLIPYSELLRQIREESAIPIRCLIRPRPGDFLYSKEELDLILRQIRSFRKPAPRLWQPPGQHCTPNGNNPVIFNGRLYSFESL